MKIIEELIEDLTSSSTNIESALLKAQVLAHQLGDADLKKWVEDELRGYETNASVPDYRILKVTLIGNVSNGYWRHNEVTLPVLHIEDGIRKKLTTREVRESISAIREMADPEKKFAVNIHREYYPLIAKNFEKGYAIEHARGMYSPGSMTQIITEVKSRLLGFVLSLSDKISDRTSASELKEIAERIGVNKMFNNAVFGNNTTIIIGSNNNQSISNEIRKNDVDSLFNFLRKNSVCEEDISDLSNAITTDSSAITAGKDAPAAEVNSWIKRMTTKAGTASWQISTEAAGNLLAAAIAAFYGLTT